MASEIALLGSLRYLSKLEIAVTEKNETNKKPVTLADYIPPVREPVAKPKRSAPSKRDRDRLGALDREVRDDDAQETKPARRTSGKKKPNVWTIVFYCVVLVIILKVLD